MKDKILITGILGFVGSHLAEYLLDRGYDVCGIAMPQEPVDNIAHLSYRKRDHEKELSTGDFAQDLEGVIDVFYSDIRNENRIKEIVNMVKPKYIYHLAAVASVSTATNNPKNTFDVNLYGSINILEAVKEICPNSRILIVGSAEEYGLITEDNIPITEDCPLNPVNIYAISKVSVDSLGLLYVKNYGFNMVRVRPFSHTGPRQNSNFVCSNFAKQIALIENKKQKPLISVGNLQAKRDFTDVRDMVRAYHVALEEGECGEVYNICSGQAYSIQEILDILLNLTKAEIKVERKQDRMRPSDIPILMGDYTKFKQKSGWSPQIPLKKTLEDLLNYWRERV